MIEALLHVNITKDADGVYHGVVRNQAFADLLIAKSASKGIKIQLEVKKSVKYFKTKEEKVEYLMATNENFKAFVDFFGLILIK